MPHREAQRHPTINHLDLYLGEDGSIAEVEISHHNDKMERQRPLKIVTPLREGLTSHEDTIFQSEIIF